MDRRILDLLIVFVSKCRENWALTGDCSVSKGVLKEALLEKLKQKHGLGKDLTWSNYKQKSLSQNIIDEIERNQNSFENDLEILSNSKFTRLEGEGIVNLVPFDKLLENVLSRESMVVQNATNEIASFFAGPAKEMLEFLEYAGLVTRENDAVKSNVLPFKEIVLDDVLTFIEERDALQIRYGIYDTLISGSDLFAGMKLPGDPFYIKLEYSLRTLMGEKFLLPLNLPGDIRKWEFRSRIAEIVRLLSKLRQRFRDHHSYRDSPKLTRSVKLEVVNRKFPRRTIELSKCVTETENQMRSGGTWSSFADSWRSMSSVLIESLKERGFETISDFQDRCFKKIFGHLADPQSSSRGLVISAGTGMGKTLSYIGPLLLYILFEKTEKKVVGTKAICVYPRIKLAENQIDGFIKSIYKMNQRLGPEKLRVNIGIDYTGTPYRRTAFKEEPKNGALFVEGMNRLWKYDKEKDAYECPYARCPECNEGLYIERKSDFSNKVPLKCLNSHCSISIDFVTYCKDDIAAEPPDIFITTTETLTRRLSSARFQGLFGVENLSTPKLVMIDEIHLHTSLKGSQVAFLIRRLLQRIILGLQCSQQTLGEPIVLGLSATIGHAEEFFSELTGIPEYLIEVEGPTEEELEKSGVEYFIFVKPEIGENIAILSNLIQTCMSTLHNMPQHQDFPKVSRKALGFVDSLDLVRRWQHDFKDAERQGLYQLRDPDNINSNPKIRNYFGPLTVNCANCLVAVNRNCVHFREGECWWFLRFGNSQTNPLRVHYKTAGDGHVPLKYDLVVTTSAMEVGYDDPDIMCIMQYQSPMNIASFTQRKGRAGREIRNRPISIAVLSPYRTKDVYYFRNHHILIEPSFEKLPLNVDNKAIKKIHGFYAVLDLLAFEKRANASDFPAYLDKSRVEELEETLRRRKKFVERYLKKIFNYKITEQELDEIWSLFRELIKRIDSLKPGEGREPSDILEEHLPRNLFSSINLPTANVYEYNVYSGNEEWRRSWRSGCSQNPNLPRGFLEILEGGYCPKQFTTCSQRRNCKPELLEGDLDVNLALAEASIANVTFRWGQTAFWIPPYDVELDTPNPLKQMDVKYNWLIRSKHQNASIFSVTSKLVPKTLKDMVPRVSNGTQNNLTVIRPDVIREVKFLTPSTDLSHWLYCFDHDTIYAGVKQFGNAHQNLTHRYDTITERTTSYPFAFYDVDFRRDLLSLEEKEGRLKKAELVSDFEAGKHFGIFGDLFPEVYFANKDTGEYLKVRKIVVGATCSINTRRTRLEKVFGYVDGDQDVGLGYGMETDGIDLWVQRQIFNPELAAKECPEVFNTLKHNFFKFEVLSANKKPGGHNSFSVNAFLNVYLTFVAQNPSSFADMTSYCTNQCVDKDFQKKFYKTLESFFTLNSRTKQDAMRLFKDPEFLNKVIAKHTELLEEKNTTLVFRYMEDSFHHSLKHALKSAFVVLGGFESERDIGGWTYLNFDYDLPKHIYVFEHGMYGTGAFRSIYHKFKADPQKLWNLLEEYLTSCTTSDEEDFLKEVLRLEDAELMGMAKMVEKITSSTKFVERKRGIQELVEAFREDYSMELRDEDVKALTRIFTKPLELENTTIENWKLFKELNTGLYNHLKNTYNRDLTIEEIQESCFAALIHNAQEPALSTWKAFFEVLKKGANSEYSLFQEKIRYDLQHVKGLKRFLDSTKLQELESIHQLSDEEQVAVVASKLGWNESSRGTKKIVEILFAEMDDEPMFTYYYPVNANISFPQNVEQKLRSSLAKRSFREEVEKRLLNTCVDACPSCLQTKCEIDFDLRSKLLLSRRLLRYIVWKLKEKHTIDVDSASSYENLKQEAIKKLEEKFQVYIKYSLGKSADVAKLVSDLLSSGVGGGGQKYYVIVNSSGYRELSLKERKVVYEIGLRCREASL